jgi:hypothetical protein
MERPDFNDSQVWADFGPGGRGLIQNTFKQNMPIWVWLFLRVGILSPYRLCKQGISHLFELERYRFRGDTHDTG